MATDREASTSTLADTKPVPASGRRRWPEAVKRELVAATLEPGASVSIVARRHDVNANQLFKWRRQLGDRTDAAAIEPVRMLPVEIVSPALAAPGRSAPARDPGRRRTEVASRAGDAPAATGSVEIKLPGGARVTITGKADPATVAAAIRAATAARRRR